MRSESVRALIKFDAPLFDLTADDLKKPDLIFQIGVVPRRIDILTSIDGVTVDDAWALRKEIVVEGLSLQVINRHHLLQNKKQTGRSKDKIDAVWLEEDSSKD